VFLCIVESSLQHNDTSYAKGTFRFREVCKHWNKVAVGSPQLWVRWASGAVKAWPLFNARSKDAPIFLTCRRHTLASSRNLLMDPAVLKRIHRLDVVGTSEQLERLLSGFGSNPPLNASSIRLQTAMSETEVDSREHLAPLLPFSFPNLSKLHIVNFQPDFSSSLLTTSNLTSLKLSFYCGIRPRYNLAQFSRILQKQPNLQELDLDDGAMPRVDSSEAPVPITLPRLADLKLRGTAECFLGLVNLIGTSSPLHNVAFHFCYPRDQNVPALVDVVKKILAAYYECEGLDRPRKADHLTVESRPGGITTPWPSSLGRAPVPPLSHSPSSSFNSTGRMSSPICFPFSR